MSFKTLARILTVAALMTAGTILAEPLRPIPVRVMVVATFEVGEDTGDQPGEYQFWVEREHLETVVPFAFARRHLRTNGKGVYAFISGGSTRCESSIMALVLDPRFDLSHTYWIINGIAGVDPYKAGLGTAAWAQWVIDGDDAFEIDSSEKETAWPYGIYPAGAKGPNVLPENLNLNNQMAYQVSPTLVQWAFALTKDTKIPDAEAMKKYRAKFTGYPNAQRPPFKVMIGDFVSSARYYYGTVMNKWADDWAKLWTNGKANYVMSADEDQGIAYALTEASKLGKVDWNRVLFLRTASDFACAPGMTAQENLQAGFPGFLPALESAYRVGSPVLHEIVAHWDLYENTPPGSAASPAPTK